MKRIELREQWDGQTFKGYRKFIHGVQFTLGKIRERAEIKCAALEARAVLLKAEGKPWTQYEIDRTIGAIYGQPEIADPAIISMSLDVPTSAGPTVHDAIDQYIVALEKSRENLEIGQGQLLSLKGRLESLKHVFMGQQGPLLYIERSPLSNKLIAEVSEDDLEVMKAFLLKRPTSLRSRQPLSVQSISNIVKVAQRFFKYAKKQKLWNGFEDWQETFVFKRNQKRNMLTASEKANKALKDHMSIDDLQSYWNSSTTRMRLLQGLAFWTAWTQQELSTFRLEEYYRDADGEAYIDKSRSKTGELGRWWIPPIIADMLDEHLKATPRNKHGLVFVTQKNMPLVNHGRGNDKSKSDQVASCWKIIQHNSQQKRGRSHSFKWFRKSMPEMIGQLTNNKFIAKAALSQKQSDVADVHYLNPLIDASILAAKDLWNKGPKGSNTPLKTIYRKLSAAEERYAVEIKQQYVQQKKEKLLATC